MKKSPAYKSGWRGVYLCMEANGRKEAGGATRETPWPVYALTGCLLFALFLGVFIAWRGKSSNQISPDTQSTSQEADSPIAGEGPAARASLFPESPGRNAEEIVASKLSAFARSRRDIVLRISRKTGKEIPAEILAFFDAMEAGNWEETDRLFQQMAKRSAQYDGSTHDESLDPFWPAVLDAYGPAQEAHLWPAEQLLEYGNAILDSLRPGMVYVGGTDPGRFIPTLLTETSGSDPHIVLTQNALADSRYLEYVQFLYGERLGLPTAEDSQRVFGEYIDDARKRLQHDEQFPDEPRQLRPGEEVKMVDGRLQVSGQIAVMDINDRLLQTILDKNPEMSFGLEESFPLETTYAEASLLGPVLEIRAGENGFDDAKARESVEYWRNRSEELLRGDTSEAALKTWAKMATAHAGILAERQFSAQAEEAYRTAVRMYPGLPEAVYGLGNFLENTGRAEEARSVIEHFKRTNPETAEGPVAKLLSSGR